MGECACLRCGEAVRCAVIICGKCARELEELLVPPEDDHAPR